MGVLTEPGHVSNGPERRRPANSAIESHREWLGRIQANAVEAHIRGARSGSRCHQQAIGVDARPALEDGPNSTAASLDPIDRDSAPYLDPGRAECFVDDDADLRREIRERVRRGVEQVKLGAEPGKDRCEFTTDHASTHDRES